MINGVLVRLSALSCHGIPLVVDNLKRTVQRTVDNPQYRWLQQRLEKQSQESLYQTRFAPFCVATPLQKEEWVKLDFLYENVLAGMQRVLEETVEELIPWQDVVKQKADLFPGAPHINVEKNAQTVAKGLWVLGIPSSVYQKVYQEFRQLNEMEQKSYMGFLSTCAITKMLEIQKVRPKWFSNLNYEQLYGVYTLRRALAPKSKSLSVLAQMKHVTVPHKKEDNEIFSHVVDCAIEELSLKPRAVLEMHRSYKACFESGRETGGINGFSEKMWKAQALKRPELFRSNMNPSEDIPVFTEDIGQRGYVQQKQGMHLLEIAIHQLKSQGKPKLLGVVIEERGMKSRIPLVPQWCAAVVAAVIGDCLRPYVERFCKSTFHGQVHNAKRAIPKWWSSGDFENSSDNLKFAKLQIAGKKLLANCSWPKQFHPYLASLLECMDILLGEHLIYEIDNESLRHDVRARFQRKPISQAPTYSSNWALTGLGWGRQDGEVEKKGIWAPWDKWDEPHPRKPGETDKQYLSRLERLNKRTHAKVHERVEFPTWTGTRGKMGVIRAEARDLTFQELQLRKSYLDKYPCIISKRSVGMCYGLSFPIMSFMTWISHYEMTRTFVPFSTRIPIRGKYGFDITGDDNSSGHEDHKSMDELDERFIDKGFVINKAKSYRSQIGYIHAENVYVYPIIGTQPRKRVDIREPKMKVLFPDSSGANWADLPQIVFREFTKCRPEVQLRAQALLYSRYYMSYKKCLNNGLDIFSIPRQPIIPINFSKKEPNNQLLGPVISGYYADVQNLFTCKTRAPRAEISIERILEIISFCKEKPNHLKPSIPDAAEVKDYSFEGFGKIALKWFQKPPWEKLQIPGRPIKITADIAINRFNRLPNKGGHINLKDIPAHIQVNTYISTSIADLTRGFHWVPTSERIDLRGAWPLKHAFTVVDYRNIFRDLGAYQYIDVIGATIDYFGLPPEEAVIIVDDWLYYPELRFGIHWVLKAYPTADHTILAACKQGRKQNCWVRVLTKDKDLQRKCAKLGAKHIVDQIEWNKFGLKRRLEFPDLYEIQGQPKGYGENVKRVLYERIKRCLREGRDPFLDQRSLQIAASVPAEQLPGILARLGAKPDPRWDSFRLGLNEQLLREVQRIEAKEGPIVDGVFEDFIRSQIPEERPEVKIAPVVMAPMRSPPNFERDDKIRSSNWRRQEKEFGDTGRGRSRGRGRNTARSRSGSRGRGHYTTRRGGRRGW